MPEYVVSRTRMYYHTLPLSIVSYLQLRGLIIDAFFMKSSAVHSSLHKESVRMYYKLLKLSYPEIVPVDL